MRIQVDGEKLKAQMIRSRVSVTELAGMLSVNKSTVYRALRGGFVHLATLQKMEDFFSLQAGGLVL